MYNCADADTAHSLVFGGIMTPELKAEIARLPIEVQTQLTMLCPFPYDAPNCEKHQYSAGFLREIHDLIVALYMEIERRDKALKMCEEMLKKQHKWHLEIGKVIFPKSEESGLDEPIELDLSSEYIESSLYEDTSKALKEITAIMKGADNDD